MRILRFLQDRPYWFYKLSALALIISFVFTAVEIATARNEVIFYPVVVSLEMLSLCLFIVTFTAFVGESVIYFTRHPRNSFGVHVGIALLIVIFAFIGISVIGSHIGDTHIFHVSSISYGNRVYNLAENGWGLVNFATTQQHALYECDRYGVICRMLDKFNLVTEIHIPPPHHITLIEMVADSAANAIVIRVDGEVAYTYALYPG